MFIWLQVKLSVHFFFIQIGPRNISTSRYSQCPQWVFTKKRQNYCFFLLFFSLCAQHICLVLTIEKWEKLEPLSHGCLALRLVFTSMSIQSQIHRLNEMLYLLLCQVLCYGWTRFFEITLNLTFDLEPPKSNAAGPYARLMIKNNNDNKHNFVIQIIVFHQIIIWVSAKLYKLLFNINNIQTLFPEHLMKM